MLKHLFYCGRVNFDQDKNNLSAKLEIVGVRITELT